MRAPLGLRLRLWLLLTAVTGFVLLAAGWIMSAQTLEQGAGQWANLVYATAIGVDEQRFASASSPQLEERLHSVGVLLRSAAPEAEIPRAPVGVAVLAKLRELRGSEAGVRFEVGPPSRLWMQSRHQPQQWIGVPVQPLGGPIARASLWILLLSGGVVLVAGAWFARALTRPLEQLARRAPNLMAGDLDLHEFRRAPSEVRALAATLAQALEQARSRHEHREQTLVGLSHDLRTPLARLRFAIEMGDHNEASARASMQADIDEMDALIGAFLLMQREGRDEVVTEFDLVELLRELVQGFRSRGAISLQHVVAVLPFRGQRLALRRALSNLLQNAFEHGCAPVTVDMGRDNGRIQVRVADNGKAPDAPTSRDGFGLGLGVVRTVAAMHGGGLQTEFGADRGIATLWLPDNGIAHADPAADVQNPPH